MDIQKLGPYFIKFNECANNDNYIDEDVEKGCYSETLAQIPDQKSRDEASKDKMIDFYEYLEATSKFSRADLTRNKERILRYSFNSTLKGHVSSNDWIWDFPEDDDKFVSFYQKSSDTNKEIILSSTLSHIKDMSFRRRALNLIYSAFPSCSDTRKKEILSVIRNLCRDDRDKHDWEQIASIFYLFDPADDNCSDTIRKEIDDIKKDMLTDLSSLLHNDDPALAGNAISFLTQFYRNCPDRFKPLILDKINSVLGSIILKFGDEIKRSAVDFNISIYKDAPDAMKKNIRTMIMSLLDYIIDHNENPYADPFNEGPSYAFHTYGISNDRLLAIYFYRSIYKDSSDEVKKEIIDLLGHALKDFNKDSLDAGRSAFDFYKSIYSESSDVLQVVIIGKMETLLSSNNADIRPLALNFFVSLYADCPEETKKRIFTINESLLNSDSLESAISAVNFFASIYKDSPEDTQKKIRGMIGLLLNNTAIKDPGARIAAIDFFSSAYEASPEDVRNKIRAAFLPLLKDNDEHIRSRAIDFFDRIYQDGSDNTKNTISSSVIPLLKDGNINVRSKTFDFMQRIYIASSDAIRNKVSASLLSLLKDGETDVRCKIISFLEGIYKDSPDNLKAVLFDRVSQVLSSRDAAVLFKALHFFGAVYKYSTGDIKARTRDAIEPLLNREFDEASSPIYIDFSEYQFMYTSFDIRISAIDFFKSIYKDLSDDIRPKIRTIINPLLKNKSFPVEVSAAEFFSSIYKDCSEGDKDSIKNELKWLLDNLKANSSNEITGLVCTIYSGKELFAEYNKNGAIPILLLCLLPAKLKEPGLDIDSLTAASMHILQIEKDFRIRTAFGFNLINGLKVLDDNYKSSVCAEIIKYIRSNKGNEVSQFLRYMLSLNRQYLPQKFKAEIEDMMSELVPKTPPYDQIFKTGRNTIRIIACFGEEQFFGFWRTKNNTILGDPDMRLVADDGHGKRTYKKVVIIGGERKEVIVDTYVKTWEAHSRAFEAGLASDDADILIYDGHAIGNIQELFTPKGRNINNKPKIIMIIACNSNKYYAPIQYYNPNCQFITTKETTAVDDAIPILKAILDVIAEKGDWNMLRNKLTVDKEKYKMSVPGNYILPDDDTYLGLRDSDNDGKWDSSDDFFDFAPSDLVIKEPDNFEAQDGVSRQPDRFPVDPVEGTINNNYLIKPFLSDHIHLPLRTSVDGGTVDSTLRNVEWTYDVQSGDKTFMIISERYGSDSNITPIEIKFNIGYAHCANEWLAVMAIADLHKYLSLRYKLDEKNEKKIIKKTGVSENLNGEEKKREFRLIVNYLASQYSKYPENRGLLEKVWEKAKNKYALPPVDLKAAILVIKKKGFLNEVVIDGEASLEDIKTVEDFFASFK